MRPKVMSPPLRARPPFLIQRTASRTAAPITSQRRLRWVEAMVAGLLLPDPLELGLDPFDVDRLAALLPLDLLFQIGLPVCGIGGVHAFIIIRARRRA